MRDLTPEELKLAPDWATMYSITSGDNVRFHDEDMFCLCNGHVVSDVASASPENFNTRLIPSKTFDITKYEFSDDYLSAVKSDGGNVFIDIEYGDFLGSRCSASAIIIKSDAIAIAKALGVTGEDLK